MKAALRAARVTLAQPRISRTRTTSLQLVLDDEPIDHRSGRTQQQGGLPALAATSMQGSREPFSLELLNGGGITTILSLCIASDSGKLAEHVVLLNPISLGPNRHSLKKKMQ